MTRLIVNRTAFASLRSSQSLALLLREANDLASLPDAYARTLTHLPRLRVGLPSFQAGLIRSRGTGDDIASRAIPINCEASSNIGLALLHNLIRWSLFKKSIGVVRSSR